MQLGRFVVVPVVRPRWRHLGLAMAFAVSVAGHLAFLAVAHAWPMPREGL